MSAYFADETLYRLIRFSKAMPFYLVIAYGYCFSDDLTLHLADSCAVWAFPPF